MDKLTLKEISEATFIFKLLWTRRNEIIHGNPFTHPTSLVNKGKMDFSQYMEVRDKIVISNRMLSVNQSDAKWQKPSRDKVKLNWDAAIDQQQRKIGMGAVFRNHEERALGTMRICRCFRGNAFIA